MAREVAASPQTVDRREETHERRRHHNGDGECNGYEAWP
jgi:hypothetical protein